MFRLLLIIAVALALIIGLARLTQRDDPLGEELDAAAEAVESFADPLSDDTEEREAVLEPADLGTVDSDLDGAAGDDLETEGGEAIMTEGAEGEGAEDVDADERGAAEDGDGSEG